MPLTVYEEVKEESAEEEDSVSHTYEDLDETLMKLEYLDKCNEDWNFKNSIVVQNIFFFAKCWSRDLKVTGTTRLLLMHAMLLDSVLFS